MPSKRKPKFVFARTTLAPIPEHSVLSFDGSDSDAEGKIWVAKTKTSQTALLSVGMLATEQGHDKKGRNVLRHTLKNGL